MDPRTDPLERAHRHAADWFGSLGKRRVPPSVTADEVADALGRDLPAGPSDPADVVDLLASACEPGLTAMPSGRFYGMVIGGTEPAALAADWLVSAWDQNDGLRTLTPAVAAVEEVAAAWLLDLLGLPPDAAVGFPTSATTANLTCLLAARDAPERLGGVEPLVEIINRSDAAIEKALLESIESRDRSLADDIRSRMFTFADIVRLDDRDAQRVLRGVDLRTLALALKGANEGIAEVIRRNVSERNRENLEFEGRSLGPVRISQVEEARAEIVHMLRGMEAAGEISVQRTDEDEYVY